MSQQIQQHQKDPDPDDDDVTGVKATVTQTTVGDARRLDFVESTHQTNEAKMKRIPIRVLLFEEILRREGSEKLS